MDRGPDTFSRAGERLLSEAAEAFYTEGIGATGVDVLCARSGVSKPTLYAQFGSKQDLVAAVLARRHIHQRAELEGRLAALPESASRKLTAVFEWLAGWHADQGRRGCGFLNAAAETPDPDAPVRPVIAAHKQWLRDLLTDLAAQAGLREPEEVGFALLLLIDGANARMLVDGDSSAAQRAGRAAQSIIEAHRPRGSRSRG